MSCEWESKTPPKSFLRGSHTWEWKVYDFLFVYSDKLELTPLPSTGRFYLNYWPFRNKTIFICKRSHLYGISVPGNAPPTYDPIYTYPPLSQWTWIEDILKVSKLHNFCLFIPLPLFLPLCWYPELFMQVQFTCMLLLCFLLQHLSLSPSLSKQTTKQRSPQGPWKSLPLGTPTSQWASTGWV